MNHGEVTVFLFKLSLHMQHNKVSLHVLSTCAVISMKQLYTTCVQEKKVSPLHLLLFRVLQMTCLLIPGETSSHSVLYVSYSIEFENYIHASTWNAFPHPSSKNHVAPSPSQSVSQKTLQSCVISKFMP